LAAQPRLKADFEEVGGAGFKVANRVGVNLDANDLESALRHDYGKRQSDKTHAEYANVLILNKHHR